ncbi:hypothetical protein OROGR_020025 [Orobanche gracilis]
MAVAGLHNASAFGPSIFGESQVSRPSTRASSLLQMWRELEGDHAVSHSQTLRRQMNSLNSDALSTSSMSDEQRIDGGSDFSVNTNENDNQDVTHSGIEHDDSNSTISEQSTELGENRREKVRHIFREWMSSGNPGHSSNGLNNRSGSQWLGENECERVRIIRERVQMNAQQRTNGEGGESASRIEQDNDGLAITRPQVGVHRPFRRICGRQTLFDLIVRAQNERRKELQGLSGQRHVSEFAHRNRIQALLRGRFLRNERSIQDKRPSSMAATELGLLRERHTVSGLSCPPERSMPRGKEKNMHSSRKKYKTTFSRQSAPPPPNSLGEGFLSKLGSSVSASVNTTESDSSSGDEDNGELECTDRERQITEIHTASHLESAANVSTSRHEFVLQVNEKENSVLDNETDVQELSSDNDMSQQQLYLDDIDTTITDELPLENENMNYDGPLEVLNEQAELDSDHTTDLEVNNNEQFKRRVEISRSWRQSHANNQWFRNASDADAFGQDEMQELHEEDDSQDVIGSWLDIPTGEVGSSVGRTRMFYFPDDDNARSMEIRELFSRKHVSSLLRSGFRESLDQVLQSRVERQINASGDWESDDASSSAGLVEQDTGQQNDGRVLSLSEADDANIFARNSTFVNESQSLWDFDLRSANMLHNGSNQQLGMEWEVVNELRVDMAKIQHRLTNMQSMLEHCLDMQTELQRSVRQEISAALNRSFLTRDESKESVFHGESQWDYVRRGICCVCRDGKIDSLLYRCGHMCTCSKCAKRLVQGSGKCPMCHAPVIESVQAYFIQ